jgi:hypothetical protein
LGDAICGNCQAVIPSSSHVFLQIYITASMTSSIGKPRPLCRHRISNYLTLPYCLDFHSTLISSTCSVYILMRFSSFPNLVRTFYSIANATAHFRTHQVPRTIQPLYRPFILRSMPSIPLLGSLFSSSTPASAKMSYPDQRSDDEWRAVLNKGKLFPVPHSRPPRSSVFTRTVINMFGT